MDNLGYVVAGYCITAAAMAAYAGNLLVRARRARVRARRDRGEVERVRPVHRTV